MNQSSTVSGRGPIGEREGIFRRYGVHCTYKMHGGDFLYVARVCVGKKWQSQNPVTSPLLSQDVDLFLHGPSLGRLYRVIPVFLFLFPFF